MTGNARPFFDLDALVDAVVERVCNRVANSVMARLADQAEQSEFCTIPEAADLLRSKRQRVDDLLSAGKLTRHRDGRRVLIERAELMAYLAGARTGPRLGAPSRPHPRRSRSQTGVSA